MSHFTLEPEIHVHPLEDHGRKDCMIRSVKIVCSSNNHVSWGNWSSMRSQYLWIYPTMLLESSILRSKKIDLMENPSECWHNNESYQSQPWEWCKPHTTKQKPPEKHSINMLPRCLSPRKHWPIPKFPQDIGAPGPFMPFPALGQVSFPGTRSKISTFQRLNFWWKKRCCT